MKLAILLSALAVACGPLLSPSPTPRIPPATEADCAAMCSTLERLACPWASPTCVDDCRSADAALRELGARGLETSCVRDAADCAAARACQ